MHVEAEDPRLHPRAPGAGGSTNTAPAGSRSCTRNGRRPTTSRCSAGRSSCTQAGPRADAWRWRRRSHVIIPTRCPTGDVLRGHAATACLAGYQDNPLPTHCFHLAAFRPDPGQKRPGWRSGSGSAGEPRRRAAVEYYTREGVGGPAGYEDHDVGRGFSSAFPRPPSDETSGEAPRPSPGGRGSPRAAARPRPAGCAVGTA